MTKSIISLILSLILYLPSYAQQGGLIYYLKNNGKLVSNKDSADYSMAVLPPDTSVDKNLYVIYEYYKNGKVRLVTNSYSNDINLLYQGGYIMYFTNGRKKKTGTFANGKPMGHEINYYPNGKVHITKNYQSAGPVFFSDCRDSTGNILAENGTGKWIEYNENFSEVIAEGNIADGKEVGEWKGSLNKYENFKSTYSNGNLVNMETFYKAKGDSIYKIADVVPEFEGGMPMFYKFLSRTVRYPAYAREHDIQGKVIISIVIEKDGTLTGIKVSHGVHKSIDDVAIQAIRASPPWKPGMVNGKPVRTAYSVPISFALSK